MENSDIKSVLIWIQRSYQVDAQTDNQACYAITNYVSSTVKNFPCVYFNIIILFVQETEV